jgi:hypothetical protein
VVQQVAQVRPRLRLAGVGPQQERKTLPRLRRLTVQQVGEQRLHPRRAQRRQGGLAVTKVEFAEKPDAQRG